MKFVRSSCPVPTKQIEGQHILSFTGFNSGKGQVDVWKAHKSSSMHSLWMNINSKLIHMVTKIFPYLKSFISKYKVYFATKTFPILGDPVWFTGLLFQNFSHSSFNLRCFIIHQKYCIITIGTNIVVWSTITLAQGKTSKLFFIIFSSNSKI